MGSNLSFHVQQHCVSVLHVCGEATCDACNGGVTYHQGAISSCEHSVCLQDTHDQHEDEYQKELKALQAKYDALYGECSSAEWPMCEVPVLNTLIVNYSDIVCFSRR